MENTKNILNEILLRMKYDSSKTLSENKKLMEQRKISNDILDDMLVRAFSYDLTDTTYGQLKQGKYEKIQDNYYGELPCYTVTFANSFVKYYITPENKKRYIQYAKNGVETQSGSWDIKNGKLESYKDQTTTKISDAMMQPSKDEEEKNKKIDQYLKSQTKSSATTTKRKYKPLNDNFVIYSYNKEHIGKLQDCLGMKIKESEKGFFGPKTLAALKNTTQFAAKASKNEPITVAEINAICGAKELPTLQSKEIEKLPAQEPAKAQPTATQQTTQQPQQELTGAARRKANRANKKSSQPEG